MNPAPKNALNTHMTYDSQARPTQITFLDRVAPSTTTVTATVTLAYNPNGQRSEYTLAEPSQLTLDEQFTYRNGMLGQLRVTKGGSLLYTDTYLYTDAGAPYELLRTNGSGATSRYWYEVDGRGNVVALTDINGKVVDRYAYDSWGELTSSDATDETVPQQLATGTTRSSPGTGSACATTTPRSSGSCSPTPVSRTASAPTPMLGMTRSTRPIRRACPVSATFGSSATLRARNISPRPFARLPLHPLRSTRWSTSVIAPCP